MLTLYRRHSVDCTKRKDRYWKRCSCAMWVEGVTSQGYYIRRSLKTSSWERAQARVRDIDAGDVKPRSAQKELRAAIDEFLEDAVVRGLKASSLRQLKATYISQFLAWCDSEGLKFVNEVDSSMLRTFRSTWQFSSQTRFAKQVHLKTFFRFCKKNHWIDDNPAEELSNIRVTRKITDYLRPDEFERLIDAASRCDSLNNHRGGLRLHAMIQLMRWSGVRISDAVTLERSRVNSRGELLLRQMKTGLPVWVPLPPHVVDALRYVPPGMRPDERYFFWSGRGNREAASDVMHKAFRKVAKAARIDKRCHPHMLRDTFAVEMLLAGVPIDQVSILLGHSSVTMTEKHYAPWVKARQDQLSKSVRNAWAMRVSSSGESES